VVPISVGGLGVREGALALFLHPLDVPTGRAVALGLLIYGMNLTVSLLGAPSFAMGSRERVEA
jgi:glycosyltransferase 2 family protein